MQDKFKKDIKSLIEKNIDPYITSSLIYYESIYDNDQIKYMLSQPAGLKLKDNIYLYYIDGIGYNCVDNITRDPKSIIIERFLNNKKNIEIK